MDSKLLELLVCPVSKGPLVYICVTSRSCGARKQLAYPVKDDIPMMVQDEARTLSEAEAASLHN